MPDDETTTPEQDDRADGESADEQSADSPADGEASLPGDDGDEENTSDGPAADEGGAEADSSEDATAGESELDATDEPAGEPGTADGEAPFNVNVVSEALAIEPETEPSIPDDVAEAVGDGAAALDELGSRVVEAFLVGLETVTSHAAQVGQVTITATDYSVVESEFAAIDHVGLELKVSLSETEAHLAAALIPLDSLSALLMVDASAEQMADSDFASAQLETISASARELLDHLSVTLVPGELEGAEVTLSEARLGQIDFTMGMIADVAQDATPVRLDVTLSLPDGGQATLSIVMPGELLGRIAESIAGSSGEASASATDTAEGTAEGPDTAPTLGTDPTNVTPFPATSEDDGTDSPPAFAPPEMSDAPGPGVGDDVPVHPVRFPELSQSAIPAASQRSIDMLMDVSMRVTVELGRSSMTVESVLGLGPGSVVELNKLAGEPVDVLINERLIARGEVVVVDENFGVRVTEIVSPRTRANAMGR